MKEARERQRRRRRQLALLLLVLAGIGGIGYGIDHGVSGGQSSPACGPAACAGATVVTSGAAPSIVAVVSEPGARRLNPGSLKIAPGKPAERLNVVPAAVNLAFKVTLRNGSKAWETNVKVTFTVFRAVRLRPGRHSRLVFRASAVQTQHTRAIGPNRTAVVTFNKRLLVPFAMATRIKVDVAAARAGKLTAKRTLNYPVIFSLP